MIEELQNLTGDITPNQTLTGELDYRVTGGKVDDVLVNGTSVVENKIANIDLTGKQDVLTAGTNITIENNVISSTASGGEDNDILVLQVDDDSEETRARVSKMINAHYGKGLLAAISNVVNPELLYNALTSQETTYQFGYHSANIYFGGNNMRQAYWFNIQGTWNENVFTCSRIIYYTTGNVGNDYRVLSVKNFSEYTPTANYHPATKKYVDDALANTSIFYAKRTEVFLNGTGGGSSNTAIDTDDLTEYNAQCLAAKQFLPIAIKSSAVSNSINFVYMPRIRFNGKLQYMAFAYTSTGVFYMSQSQEISSPVIGSLVRTDLTFTTFTLKVATTDYVDTQIGNINTVLATLTTPTNGGN